MKTESIRTIDIFGLSKRKVWQKDINSQVHDLERNNCVLMTSEIRRSRGFMRAKKKGDLVELSSRVEGTKSPSYQIEEGNE